jgi:hypothetical protein
MATPLKTRVDRRTVDLHKYPDLVVVYLGMRVNTLSGLKTLLRLGPQIETAGAARPDGLLHSEQNIIYSIFPFHVGMRWYWRDFASLEAWTRSPPHREWWTNFLRDSGGTGFWHETYSMRGGMEAIYDDLKVPVGFACFAPLSNARGSLFSARRRLDLQGEVPAAPEGMSEGDLY